jgi:adenylyltransferase/sulfurtransferase
MNLQPSDENSKPGRYARQEKFASLGVAGQGRLHDGCVLICGCGALGSVLANTLVRAGIGRVRIVDRDFVELSNLQRQVLFTEQDVAENLPKAIAAKQRLAQINSEVEVEAIVADVTAANISELLQGVDVIADGTDNFETRFLLNDASFHFGIPWVFGGCVGAEGQTATIVPGETSCLRCLIPEVPPPGTTPTCDSAGVIGPIVNVVASMQATEVMKLLCGDLKKINRGLNVIDLWENRLRQVQLDGLRQDESCLTCGESDYEWLEGKRGNQPTVLCGRNAVQLAAVIEGKVDLAALESKLVGIGSVVRNPYLLRLNVTPYVITVFCDGRSVVVGTDDPAVARSVYSRFIGQ